MYVGEVDAALDQQRLDGFLGCLLGLKAQVFQIDLWYAVFSPSIDCFWRDSSIREDRRQGKRSGSFIYDSAFLQCRLDDHRVAILIPLYIVGRDDNSIDGCADAI